jgi:hypothetical protein
MAIDRRPEKDCAEVGSITTKASRQPKVRKYSCRFIRPQTLGPAGRGPPEILEGL